MSTSSKDAANELKDLFNLPPADADEEVIFSGDEDSDVMSDDGQDREEERNSDKEKDSDDAASEEKHEVSEPAEIHESHSDISKEHAIKVENDDSDVVEEKPIGTDGNVHDDSDVVEENHIGTEVHEEKDNHPIQEDEDVHGEHDDLKEQDGVTKTVEDKHFNEATHDIEDTKAN